MVSIMLFSCGYVILIGKTGIIIGPGMLMIFRYDTDIVLLTCGK